MEFSKVQGGFGSNVRNNRFANELDYPELFDELQMTITMCSVPYDVGNIHVGNSIITGKGNIVGWESWEQRDAYFASIKDKRVFKTKFRRFHNNDTIMVPLPFYEVAQYNYIIVDHEDFPTEYGVEGVIRRTFYFVRDFNMKSPNSTEVEILRDDWTTYVNLIEFKQFSMVRGHYAVANTSVEGYLANPLENNRYLLTNTDYNTERGRVPYTNRLVFNEGEQVFVMAFKADPELSEKYKIAPTDSSSESAFNIKIVAFEPSDVPTLMENIPAALYRAILWTAFLPSDFIDFQDAIDLFECTGYTVNIGDNKNTQLMRLDRSMFGFDDKYAGLAKLYTFPYSAIQLYDETGRGNMVRIEDTTGTIYLHASFLATLAGCSINASITGIGSPSRLFSIQSVGQRDIYIGGKWYTNIFNWSVPTFALVQDPYASNDVDTKADRDARMAITEESNDAATDNTETSNELNETNTAIANESLLHMNAKDNDLIRYNKDVANLVVNATALSEIEAASMQASISSYTSTLSGIYGVATHLGLDYSSDAPALKVADVTNAYAAGSASPTLAIANGQTLLQAQYTAFQNESAEYAAEIYNGAKASNTYAVNEDTTEAANAASSAMTKRSCDAAYANAETTNAELLNNGYRLEPPAYGIEGNNALAPYGIFANIETASSDDIRRAGDDFLRYGYPMEGIIEFETFNVMPKFSYWQIDDMWVAPSGISDAAMDGIRFLLMGGVTIWNPKYIDQIGRISIYDNKE